MEAIDTGLRPSVEQVVEVAFQKTADVIGREHPVRLPRGEGQEAHEAGQGAGHDVLILFGGTIQKDEIAVLKNEGVHGVSPFHATLEPITTFIRDNVK